MLRKLRKVGWLPVLVFFATILVALSLSFAIHTKNARSDQVRLEYLLTSIADRIVFELQSFDYVNRIVEFLIIDSHGMFDDFTGFAKSMVDDHPKIKRIAVVEAGAISHVYPREAKGFTASEIFEDPYLSAHAVYSRDTGHDVVAGPYPAPDGKGREITLLHPIFPELPNGGHRFWGFAMVTVGFPAALADVDLDKLVSNGYEYRISHAIPDSSDPVVLESTSSILEDPVSVNFTVSNRDWNFTVAPRGGWFNRAIALGEFLIWFLVAVSASIFTWLYQWLNRRNRMLAEMTIRDDLTHLFNLRHFLSVLRRLDSERRNYGVIYIDLNDFKQINDTYGHEAGNTVLREVAARLKACLRLGGAGTVFRIGGDEFAVVVDSEYSQRAYEGIITKTRVEVEQPIRIQPTVTLVPRISAGFAFRPEHGERYQELIRLADERMYENKQEIKRRRAGGDGPSAGHGLEGGATA
ncbi:MAG: sensor domain-containing diguanylate cyclase [Succinivibrionaceae bacterium]|nr:sensor domain-containing diguanylate cyclase [Succinivibrionaceae bacterium]